MAKTLHSQYRGPGCDPRSGNWIACATAKTRHSQINKSIQQKRLPIPVLLFVKSINVSVYSSPVACLYKLSFFFASKIVLVMGFPGSLVVKNLPANARDMGSVPDPGRSHMSQSN